MRAIDKAEKETGEKKVWFANITSDVREMEKRLKLVADYGNPYIMVDVVVTGWSALTYIRDLAEEYGLAIHAHRAMHAALTKNKKHGITMLALAKLIRLIGMDQLHIGTAVGKMEGSKIEIREIEDEIEDNFFRQVLTRGRSGKSKSSGAKTRNNSRRLHFLEQDWYGFKPVFAVASGGLHPGLVPKLVDFLGKDIIIQAGGGIHGHPMGTRAGAKAMRQAIDSVMQGIPIREYAKKHKELKAAIQLWGA